MYATLDLTLAECYIISKHLTATHQMTSEMITATKTWILATKMCTNCPLHKATSAIYTLWLQKLTLSVFCRSFPECLFGLGNWQAKTWNSDPKFIGRSEPQHLDAVKKQRDVSSYNDFYDKDTMVMRPFYLYNEQSYSARTESKCIETPTLWFLR